MLKMRNYSIELQEIPGEIVLLINVSECIYNCDDCALIESKSTHDVQLITNKLSELSKIHDEITCICLKGGDNDHNYLRYLADVIHLNTNLKVAIFSMDKDIDEQLLKSVDYYQINTCGNKELFFITDEGQLQKIL